MDKSSCIVFTIKCDKPLINKKFRKRRHTHLIYRGSILSASNWALCSPIAKWVVTLINNIHSLVKTCSCIECVVVCSEYLGPVALADPLHGLDSLATDLPLIFLGHFL